MYMNACSSIAHTSHNTVVIQSYRVVDIEGTLLFCPVMIMVSLPSVSRCGTHTYYDIMHTSNNTTVVFRVGRPNP